MLSLMLFNNFNCLILFVFLSSGNDLFWRHRLNATFLAYGNLPKGFKLPFELGIFRRLRPISTF